MSKSSRIACQNESEAEEKHGCKREDDVKMKSVRRNGNMCKDIEEPSVKRNTRTAEQSPLNSMNPEGDSEEEEKVPPKYNQTLLHPKESKKRINRNKLKEAEQKRLKKLNETEEERMKRRKISLESKRRALARETEEQKAQRLARNAKSARERKRRLRIENEEALIEQRKRYAANTRRKRQNENEEERIERLKRLAENKRNRIARETEEQKTRRLERNKEWSRQKRLRLKMKREALEEGVQPSGTENELIQVRKKKKSTKRVSGGEMTTVTSENRSQKLKKLVESARGRKLKGIRNMGKVRGKRLQMKIQRDDMYPELETSEIASERIQNLILRTNRTGIRKVLKYKAARVLLNMFLTDLGNLNEEILSIYKTFKQTVCEAVKNVFISHQAGNKKDGGSYMCSHCSHAFQNSSLLTQHQISCGHDSLLQNSSDNMSHATKKYSCNICEKKFATQLGFVIHQQQHNSSEFYCPFCLQIFTQMNLMKAHYLQGHSSYIRIKSDEVVDEEVERAMHDLDFLDSKRCKSCLKPCFTQAQYGSHVLTEHQDNTELMNYCTFICSQCNESFATRVGLEGHWTNICLAKWKDCGNSNNNFVVCGLCGLKFGNAKSLSSHNEIFHLEKTFTCEQCGNSFVDALHLSMHIYNIHKIVKRFSCEICGKKFKHSSRLSTHKSTVHSVEKLAECHICSKRFVSRYNLNNHLRIHAGNKPYKCNFCDKHYASLAARSVHELAHKGYYCKVCGKSFGTYFNLCSHRKIHRENAGFTTEKSLSCNVCKKTFSKYVNMYQHMRNTHGPVSYACDVCDKKYKSISLLKSHKYIHDSWKGFGCSICAKTFRQRGNFYLHRKTRHKDLGAKLVILRKNEDQEDEAIEETIKHQRECTPEKVTDTSKDQIPKNYNDSSKFVIIIPESTAKTQNFFYESQNVNLNEWQDFPGDDYSVEIEFEDDGINQLESQNEQISITFDPTVSSIEFSDFSNTIEAKIVSSAYIDFSRANVPLDSIQPQTYVNNNSGSADETREDIEIETELGINRIELIENEELVADSIATTNISADTAMIKEEEQSNKPLDDYFDDTMDREIGDDTINDDDVEPENLENGMKTRQFPLDPFSPQLIVKLTKMKTYNCVPCSALFLTTKQLRSHQARRSHKIAVDTSKIVPSSYMCNYCGKEFVTKEEMRQHDKMTNIQCKYCPRVYRNEQLLFKHYNNTHRRENVFECEICQERFEVLSYLKHHKITVHLNKTDSNRNSATEESKPDTEVKVRIANIYTCVDCSQQCPGYKKYQEHRKTHKNLTPCAHCDSQFASHLKLRQHCYTEHPGKDPFKCEMCPEFFKNPQSRTRHINKVHLDKPELNRRPKTVRDSNSKKDAKCDLCGKAFYSKWLVKLHFRDVHKERQFECDICNKKFRRLRDLDRHRVRHTGKREFLCSECGKAFFSAVELKSHVECVHANIRRSYVRRKCREIKYFCPHCPARYAKESGIKLHMELHDPNRPYACNICGLRYKFQNNVATHKNYVHKEEPMSESVTTVQEC